MDESQDPSPHPHVSALAKEPHEVAPDAAGAHARNELSIWFFCGILTLAFGFVLAVEGVCERFQLLGQHQPNTVLANLQPTLWWGLLLFLFGAFYTIRFRPRS